jgi:hypothetical protein
VVTTSAPLLAEELAARAQPPALEQPVPAQQE